MSEPKHTSQMCDRAELEKKWQEWQTTPFIGYVWMSNRPLGRVFPEPQPLPPWPELHHDGNFIWEAALYAADNCSISLRQVDDRWLVSEVVWGGNPQDAAGEYQEHTYLGAGVRREVKLKFIESWQPQPDPLCCNMEVLCPTWIAFVGFQQEEQNG